MALSAWPIIVDQLVENWQRSDLNAYELHDALVALRDAHGMTQEEIATPHWQTQERNFSACIAGEDQARTASALATGYKWQAKSKTPCMQSPVSRKINRRHSSQKFGRRSSPQLRPREL